MNVKDDAYAQMPVSANLSQATGEEISFQEVSHVFHCMQCDLEFQVDMAMASSNGSNERDAGIVCVRLDPHSKLERET
jgi:hypothetical protein